MTNDRNRTRANIALIVCLILSVISVVFVMNSGFGKGFLILFIPFSIIIPCVFIYPDPIDHLKIFKFELKLRNIEQKEKELKELALAVADLVEVATSCSIMSEDFDEDKLQKALKKVRET